MGFGLVFLQRTGAVPQERFTPAGPTSWVLDVPPEVSLANLKEACLFLAADAQLPPGQALSLYVSADGAEFSYRGSVSAAQPSDVFALRWPGVGEPEAPAGTAAAAAAAATLPQWAGQSGAAPPGGGALRPRVGVSLEPLAEAAQREGERLGSREDFAKRVAMDLFRFLESFAGGDQGQMAIPAHFLDAWLQKFTRRFRADPDYLTRQGNPV